MSWYQHPQYDIGMDLQGRKSNTLNWSMQVSEVGVFMDFNKFCNHSGIDSFKRIFLALLDMVV